MTIFGESHTEYWESINNQFKKGIEPNTIYKKLKEEQDRRSNEKRAAQTKLIYTENIKIRNFLFKPIKIFVPSLILPYMV